MTKTTTIIGITGASGAGKSRLATLLHQRLREEHSVEDVAILHEDSYYRDRSDLSLEDRAKINYDHPDAFDHELLIDHLNQFRAGQTVDVPQYDYTQHNRRPELANRQPSRILILEGILLLHDPRLRELLDLKLFVDVAMDVCLCRRLPRDIVERGRSLESVLGQYEKNVRPMFYKFINPTKQHADLIVPRGGENKNALMVLHYYLQQLL